MAEVLSVVESKEELESLDGLIEAINDTLDILEDDEIDEKDKQELLDLFLKDLADLEKGIQELKKSKNEDVRDASENLLGSIGLLKELSGDMGKQIDKQNKQKSEAPGSSVMSTLSGVAGSVTNRKDWIGKTSPILDRGETAEVHDLEIAWESADAATRVKILMAGVEALATGPELTPKQEAQMVQLESIETLIKGLSTYLVDKENQKFMATPIRWIRSAKDKPQVESIDAEFESHKAEIVTRVLAGESVKDVLESLIPDFDEILLYLTQTLTGNGGKTIHVGLFREVETMDDANLVRAQAIQLLRGEETGGQYELAAELAMRGLSDQFAEAKANANLDVAAMRTKARGKVERKWSEQQRKDVLTQISDQASVEGKKIGNEEMRGMVDAYFEELVALELEHDLKKSVSSHIQEEGIYKTFSVGERAVWDQYKDAKGIGYLDISDKHWDTITRELVINAPAIILSGGVAGVAMGATRGVLSKGAISALGTMGTRGASTLRFVQASRGLRLAGVVAGYGGEGAIFATVHKGYMMAIRQEEWFKSMPEFMMSAVWSGVAIGAFKTSMPAFTRWSQGLSKLPAKIPIPKKLAPMATAISRELGGAGPVFEKALALMSTISLEAALIFMLGVVQSGVHGESDSLKDRLQVYMMDDFGDNAFHALVAAGSLKAAGSAQHHVLSAMRSKISKRNTETEKPVESAPKETITREKAIETLEFLQEGFQLLDSSFDLVVLTFSNNPQLKLNIKGKGERPTKSEIKTAIAERMAEIAKDLEIVGRFENPADLISQIKNDVLVSEVRDGKLKNSVEVEVSSTLTREQLLNPDGKSFTLLGNKVLREFHNKGGEIVINTESGSFKGVHDVKTKEFKYFRLVESGWSTIGVKVFNSIAASEITKIEYKALSETGKGKTTAETVEVSVLGKDKIRTKDGELSADAKALQRKISEEGGEMDIVVGSKTYFVKKTKFGFESVEKTEGEFGLVDLGNGLKSNKKSMQIGERLIMLSDIDSITYRPHEAKAEPKVEAPPPIEATRWLRGKDVVRIEEAGIRSGEQLSDAVVKLNTRMEKEGGEMIVEAGDSVFKKVSDVKSGESTYFEYSNNKWEVANKDIETKIPANEIKRIEYKPPNKSEKGAVKGEKLKDGADAETGSDLFDTTKLLTMEDVPFGYINGKGVMKGDVVRLDLSKGRFGVGKKGDVVEGVVTNIEGGDLTVAISGKKNKVIKFKDGTVDLKEVTRLEQRISTDELVYRLRELQENEALYFSEEGLQSFLIRRGDKFVLWKEGVEIQVEWSYSRKGDETVLDIFKFNKNNDYEINISTQEVFIGPRNTVYESRFNKIKYSEKDTSTTGHENALSTGKRPPFRKDVVDVEKVEREWKQACEKYELKSEKPIEPTELSTEFSQFMRGETGQIVALVRNGTTIRLVKDGGMIWAETVGHEKGGRWHKISDLNIILTDNGIEFGGTLARTGGIREMVRGGISRNGIESSTASKPEVKVSKSPEPVVSKQAKEVVSVENVKMLPFVRSYEVNGETVQVGDRVSFEMSRGLVTKSTVAVVGVFQGIGKNGEIIIKSGKKKSKAYEADKMQDIGVDTPAKNVMNEGKVEFLLTQIKSDGSGDVIVLTINGERHTLSYDSTGREFVLSKEDGGVERFGLEQVGIREGEFCVGAFSKVESVGSETVSVRRGPEHLPAEVKPKKTTKAEPVALRKMETDIKTKEYKKIEDLNGDLNAYAKALGLGSEVKCSMRFETMGKLNASKDNMLSLLSGLTEAGVQIDVLHFDRTFSVRVQPDGVHVGIDGYAPGKTMSEVMEVAQHQKLSKELSKEFGEIVGLAPKDAPADVVEAVGRMKEVKAEIPLDVNDRFILSPSGKGTSSFDTMSKRNYIWGRNTDGSPKAVAELKGEIVKLRKEMKEREKKEEPVEKKEATDKAKLEQLSESVSKRMKSLNNTEISISSLTRLVNDIKALRKLQKEQEQTETHESDLVMLEALLDVFQTEKIVLKLDLHGIGRKDIEKFESEQQKVEKAKEDVLKSLKDNGYKVDGSNPLVNKLDGLISYYKSKIIELSKSVSREDPVEKKEATDKAKLDTLSGVVDKRIKSLNSAEISIRSLDRLITSIKELRQLQKEQKQTETHESELVKFEALSKRFADVDVTIKTANSMSENSATEILKSQLDLLKQAKVDLSKNLKENGYELDVSNPIVAKLDSMISQYVSKINVLLREARSKEDAQMRPLTERGEIAERWKNLQAGDEIIPFMGNKFVVIESGRNPTVVVEGAFKPILLSNLHVFVHTVQKITPRGKEHLEQVISAMENNLKRELSSNTVDQSPINSHFRTLGIHRGVTKAQAKSAYRKLVLKFHPDTYTGADLAGAEAKVKKINEAWEYLEDNFNFRG